MSVEPEPALEGSEAQADTRPQKSSQSPNPEPDARDSPQCVESNSSRRPTPEVQRVVLAYSKLPFQSMPYLSLTVSA
jgi:hypothetical protein